MAHSGLFARTRVAAVCLAGMAASGCSSIDSNPPSESSTNAVAVSRLSLDLKYARVDINKLVASEREKLKSRAGIQRWIEVDRELLVLASSAVIESLRSSYNVTTLDVVPRPDALCLVHQRRDQPEAVVGGTVLARSSSLVVFQANSSGGCEGALSKDSSASARALTTNEVVASQLGGGASVAMAVSDQNPLTVDVVEALDMDRWLQDVETLASFDRYALRGASIGQAKEWIAGQFCEIAGAGLEPEAPAGSVGYRCQRGNMEVRTEPFWVSSVENRNVILTLQGFRNDGPVFVVGGHYDSTARGATPAPGAEDNASGTAAVIEMARAIAQYPTDATFVFIAFSGEEQGLLGSEYYVDQLAGTDLAQRIEAVVIMDMIGYSGDAELDCLLETADTPENLALVEHLANMASVYAPELVLSTSTGFGGSDHAPFLGSGYTGLLTIENDYGIYPYYHTVNDTFANQNARFQSMAAAIIRMNTAALAEWSAPNTFLAALMCILPR